MNTTNRIAARVTELVAQRRPFVQATIVRAQCPTSARPGDAAVVLPDGSIEGFIGGHCAEGSVRTAALGVLESGESLLLRILPDQSDDYPDAPGAETVVNPCLSGGAVEVFLEPMIPALRVAVVGHTPIADAIVSIGQSLGYALQAEPEGFSSESEPAAAVIIASHGRHEPESIRASLDAGIGFIGLVASAKRGDAVLTDLGISDEDRKRVHCPVGIWIGAKTAEEIALSILADVVKAVRLDGLQMPNTSHASLPATAIDPVCGMEVTVAPTTPTLHHDGIDHWFCNPGCRTRFAEELGVA